MAAYNEENIKKNKEAMDGTLAIGASILAPVMENVVKSVNDFAEYLENKPPRAVVVVANDSNGICKCGSARNLNKYKGKYYCANCLNKKLRW